MSDNKEGVEGIGVTAAIKVNGEMTIGIGCNGDDHIIVLPFYANHLSDALHSGVS